MAEENQSGTPVEGAAPAAAPEAPATTTQSPAAQAAAADAAGGIVNVLKTNSTARYVLIGAVALAVLASMMGGGESVKNAPVAVVGVGSNVVLDNPNGGISQLTQGPGIVNVSGANDDDGTEQNVCKAQPGTRATVEEEQVVGMLPFVKVKVLDGDCQGKSGWIAKVNVKAG
jgi:hypothetical protein